MLVNATCAGAPFTFIALATCCAFSSLSSAANDTTNPVGAAAGEEVPGTGATLVVSAAVGGKFTAPAFCGEGYVPASAALLEPRQGFDPRVLQVPAFCGVDDAASESVGRLSLGKVTG